MREPSPRAPFDQGLFLTHFNKGKAFYDERRFEDAERELEEAYLLRPRDQRVLNLLGLVYFRQDKLEKAEEVYRKLTAESPEAHTLFYNLGLIYFKLSRLEEAELAFLKALELTRDNPKINFYLGSIYERLHQYQDAIYQYRQAGANLMVRRVEDKIAAASPSRPAGVLASSPAADDTAEFNARDVREALRRRQEDTLAPARPLQPVSESLLADGAPKPVRTDTVPKPVRTDTARFRLSAAAAASVPAASAEESPTARTLPPTGHQAFRALENNLMEVEFSGKVYIKQGTIYSYGGNLTFWVKDKRPGGHAALVIVTGTGKVILTDKDRQITFMQVENEVIHVEPAHLLACEEQLNPRYVAVGDGGLEFLALEGRGMVALSVIGKPLPLAVGAELPVSVPSSSIITWSGDLTPKLVEDRSLYEVMLPGAVPGSVVRLEGSGRVLVEQALA
ncbi:MAG TPA: tetratricopeptide repeat protein [Vicinamibacteria bacterium]